MSYEVVVTDEGVHIELHKKSNDWPVVVAVSRSDVELEFTEWFVVVVVDVVKFAARSRPPLFCCERKRLFTRTTRSLSGLSQFKIFSLFDEVVISYYTALCTFAV